MADPGACGCSRNRLGWLRKLGSPWRDPAATSAAARRRLAGRSECPVPRVGGKGLGHGSGATRQPAARFRKLELLTTRKGGAVCVARIIGALEIEGHSREPDAHAPSGDQHLLSLGPAAAAAGRVARAGDERSTVAG